jgi:hypothetical protein
MDRREIIKQIAALTGAAFVGGEFFITGCKSEPATKAATAGWTDIDKQLLNEIAETILPKTATAGAKDALVGDFMTVMVDDTYKKDQQDVFKQGLQDLQERSKTNYKKTFLEMTPSERTELLKLLDQEAKEHQKKLSASGAAGIMNVDTAAYSKAAQPNLPHYFTLMKQLTLLGFFTSKIGSTEVLRHVAVPGRYEGCIPYQKGDRAWATT